MRYMAIPGRGSGGNAEVDSRWAAEFDHEPGDLDDDSAELDPQS